MRDRRRESGDSPGPRWAAVAGATGFLVLATWLYLGYRYNVGGQPGYLGYVLELRGDLANDFSTGGPIQHFAVAHLFALFPESLLPVAIGVVYFLSLAVLWAAFLYVCDSLGASLAVGTAAGLVLIPTALGGFGASEMLHDYLYPNLPGFAFWLSSLALVLRRRFVLGGVALGLSAMFHPGLGPLFAVVIAPVVLFGEGRVRMREALRFALPAALIGLPFVLQTVLSSGGGGPMSPDEHFDLVVVVRAPLHYLYSSFPAWEYGRTALWAGVLLLGLIVMRRQAASRVLMLLTGTAVLLMIAGAIASAGGGPVMLLIAQTSRLSALIVVLGVAVAASALQRLLGSPSATVILLGIFAWAPAAAETLEWTSAIGWQVGAAEAGMLLVALGLALVLAPAGQESRPRPLLHFARSPAIAAVIVVLLGAISVSLLEREQGAGLRVDAGTRAVALRQEQALKDIAAAAREATDPGELVLASPWASWLQVWSERPSVADYAMPPFPPDRLAEWQRRITDLAGDPSILDVEPFGTDYTARAKAIDVGYQTQIGRSPELICRWSARAVVARPLESPPPWLAEVYENSVYALYRPKPGTCSGRQDRATHVRSGRDATAFRSSPPPRSSFEAQEQG